MSNFYGHEDFASIIEENNAQLAISVISGMSLKKGKWHSHCHDCGEEMEEARMKTGAKNCIDCQEAIEKQNRFKTLL